MLEPDTSVLTNRPIVHILPGNQIPRIESERYIIVANQEVLDRALPVLIQHIASVYKSTDLNVYPLKGGKFAIASADPNFYMGIGENSALYSQTPPIPNAVADIDNGALVQVGIERYTVSGNRFLRMILNKFGAGSWLDNINPPGLKKEAGKKARIGGPERFINDEAGKGCGDKE